MIGNNGQPILSSIVLIVANITYTLNTQNQVGSTWPLWLQTLAVGANNVVMESSELLENVNGGYPIPSVNVGVFQKEKQTCEYIAFVQTNEKGYVTSWPVLIGSQYIDVVYTPTRVINWTAVSGVTGPGGKFYPSLSMMIA